MANGINRVLGAAMAGEVPLSIHFDLTNRCNEDCAHCYVDLGDVEGELETAEVLRILGELRDAGTLFLTFSGGEIFTRKDVLTIVRHARACGFALRLFTNGTLVDDAKAREIAEVGVLCVEISLYSTDAEKHDAITRIPGSHAKTVRAIRALRAHGVTVCVKSPILRSMPEAYRDIMAFAQDVGAEYRFDPTLVARNDLDETPLSHRMQSADFYDLCKDPSLGLAADPAKAIPKGPGEANCSTARRVALISARGLVYPCSQRFPPAGSLRKNSFRTIWETSPLLLRLRNITAQDLSTCGTCENASFCGRCYLDAKQEDGDFWGPSSWAQLTAKARLQAFGEGTTPAQLVESRYGDRRPACEI